MLSTILICLSVILTGTALYFLMVRRLDLEKFYFSAALRSYFEPKGEGESSEFAELVNVISTIFAEKTSQSLKATFMGIQSADSRQEQAIAGDIVEGLANEQNPLIGVLLERFPALKKRVAKNPQLLAMVGEIGAKFVGSGPGSRRSTSTGNGSREFSFNL